LKDASTSQQKLMCGYPEVCRTAITLQQTAANHAKHIRRLIMMIALEWLANN
jgi:hypothetical protein